MKKKQLITASILLGAVAVVAVVAIFVDALTDYPVYESPVIIAALALLALGTLFGCFNKNVLSLRGIGILIGHLSFVLLLAAAFVGYVWGQSGQMTFVSGAYGSRTVYGQEKNGNRYYFDLPFTVEVSDFSVSYEPYRYDYSVVENGQFVKKGSSGLSENGLDCKNYGVIPLSEFVQSDGTLGTQVQYKDLLATWDGKMPGVSGYTAVICFSDEDGSAVPLTVNHPVAHGGYKFYLTSYSVQGSESGMDYLVSVKVKRDPAINLAVAALILCTIGTFLICFAPDKRRKKTDKTEVSADE